MAKRNVAPADTWLADFRESAGLTPPPRTLSNAASRLVDLLDELLYSLQCGWDIPPGFPRDRFVPSVYGRRDLVVPIVQYLDDFSFTGDASRLHEATRQFYAHRDWRLMTPRPGDDKGWKEFQQHYVNPLVHKAGCLSAVIRETRQLIITAGARGIAAKQAAEAPNPTPSVDESAYIPAKDIRLKHGPGGIALSQKQLIVILNRFPEIRWLRPTTKKGTPAPQRLSVHLVDWLNHEKAIAEWHTAAVKLGEDPPEPPSHEYDVFKDADRIRDDCEK